LNELSQLKSNILINPKNILQFLNIKAQRNTKLAIINCEQDSLNEVNIWSNQLNPYKQIILDTKITFNNAIPVIFKP